MGRMLRPEASELEWKHLFPEQKEAYLELAELLAAAVDGKDGKGPERTNRIIFFDGVSGVGKTTVYLSLKNNVARHASKSDRAKYRISQITAEHLAASCEWLDPLELEILNRPANALADLLVHIENKINTENKLDMSPAHSRSRDRQPNSILSKEECINKLGQMQNNLASLWDGNSPDRAARTSPEAFAAEIVEAARTRSHIRMSLNHLIDSIAVHFFKGKLLILPVDDLHERPAVALEIFRLFRIIHSKHFAILAMGNFDSLKFVEERKAIGDLIALTGKRSKFGQEKDVEQRGKNLAHFAVKKQFAESQIVALWPADPNVSATWNHLREGYPAKAFGLRDRQAVDPLPVLIGKILRKCKILNEKDKNNVWSEEKTRENSPELRRDLIKLPIRHLLDLQLKMNELMRRRRGSGFGPMNFYTEAKNVLNSEYSDHLAILEIRNVFDRLFLPHPTRFDRFKINQSYFIKETIPPREKSPLVEFSTNLRNYYIPPQILAWLHLLLVLAQPEQDEATDEDEGDDATGEGEDEDADDEDETPDEDEAPDEDEVDATGQDEDEAAGEDEDATAEHPYDKRFRIQRIPRILGIAKRRISTK